MKGLSSRRILAFPWHLTLNFILLRLLWPQLHCYVTVTTRLLLVLCNMTTLMKCFTRMEFTGDEIQNTCKQIYYLLYKRRSTSAWKLCDVLEPPAIYLETWRQIMSAPDLQLHYGLRG